MYVIFLQLHHKGKIHIIAEMKIEDSHRNGGNLFALKRLEYAYFQEKITEREKKVI